MKNRYLRAQRRAIMAALLMMPAAIALADEFALSPDGALLAVVRPGYEQQMHVMPTNGDGDSVRWLTGAEDAQLVPQWLTSSRLLVSVIDTREAPSELIEAYAFDVDARGRPIPHLQADHMRGVRPSSAVISKSLSPRFLFGKSTGDQVRLVSRLSDEPNSVLISAHRAGASKLLKLDIYSGTTTLIEQHDVATEWVLMSESGLRARWQTLDQGPRLSWTQGSNILGTVNVAKETKLLLPPPTPQTFLMLVESGDSLALYQMDGLADTATGPLAVANEALSVTLFSDQLAIIHRDGRDLFFDQDVRDANLNASRAFGSRARLRARSEGGDIYLLETEAGAVYVYDSSQQQVRRLSY